MSRGRNGDGRRSYWRRAVSAGNDHRAPPKAAVALAGGQDLEGFFPLVAAIARRTLRWPLPVFDCDDAVATGLLGLVQSRKRLGPCTPGAFISYASLRVRGAIVDAIRALHYAPVSDGWRKRLAEQGPAMVVEGGATLANGRRRKQVTLSAFPPVSLESLVSQGENGEHRLLELPDRDPFSSPEWMTDRSEAIQEVRQALHHLSPRERQVIHLRYWRERTTVEAAQDLGVSVARVSQLEKRALGRLRRELEP